SAENGPWCEWTPRCRCWRLRHRSRGCEYQQIREPPSNRKHPPLPVLRWKTLYQWRQSGRLPRGYPYGPAGNFHPESQHFESAYDSTSLLDSIFLSVYHHYAAITRGSKKQFGEKVRSMFFRQQNLHTGSLP